TDAAIYVSLPWLKKAQPKQVREAFLHETVRRFSHDLVEQLTYNEKAKVDHTALDDEITESLTPVLFNRLPASILKERMDNATILIRNFSIDQNIISGNPKRHPRIASRAEIYADLSAVGGAKGIRKICGAVESSILFSSQSAVNETWDFLKSLSPEQRESLNKYRADFNKEPVMSLDPGAEDAMNLLTKPLPRSNYGFVDGAKVCGAKKYERFLSEYEKSGEKAQAREEGITELPSDEDATEAPAK
ncbi:MAG: hypothetical protein ACXVBE_16980, partial [Bdellovibrionota bacterium]